MSRAGNPAVHTVFALSGGTRARVSKDAHHPGLSPSIRAISGLRLVCATQDASPALGLLLLLLRHSVAPRLRFPVSGRYPGSLGSTKATFSFVTRASPGLPRLGFLTYFFSVYVTSTVLEFRPLL